MKKHRPNHDGNDLTIGARIIYFSAITELVMEERARELIEGADAFLMKPASIEQILSVVRATLNKDYA